jgi:hypothetical protein
VLRECARIVQGVAALLRALTWDPEGIFGRRKLSVEWNFFSWAKRNLASGDRALTWGVGDVASRFEFSRRRENLFFGHHLDQGL